MAHFRFGRVAFFSILLVVSPPIVLVVPFPFTADYLTTYHIVSRWGLGLSC